MHDATRQCRTLTEGGGYRRAAGHSSPSARWAALRSEPGPSLKSMINVRGWGQQQSGSNLAPPCYLSKEGDDDEDKEEEEEEDKREGRREGG